MPSPDHQLLPIPSMLLIVVLRELQIVLQIVRLGSPSSATEAALSTCARPTIARVRSFIFRIESSGASAPAVNVLGGRRDGAMGVGESAAAAAGRGAASFAMGVEVDSEASSLAASSLVLPPVRPRTPTRRLIHGAVHVRAQSSRSFVTEDGRAGDLRDDWTARVRWELVQVRRRAVLGRLLPRARRAMSGEKPRDLALMALGITLSTREDAFGDLTTKIGRAFRWGLMLLRKFERRIDRETEAVDVSGGRGRRVRCKGSGAGKLSKTAKGGEMIRESTMREWLTGRRGSALGGVGVEGMGSIDRSRGDVGGGDTLLLRDDEGEIRSKVRRRSAELGTTGTRRVGLGGGMRHERAEEAAVVFRGRSGR
jgi:hypothetical protein